MNTRTRGEFEAENGEEISQTTHAEGEATSFQMGGIGPQEPPMATEPDDKEGSDGDDDDDEDEDGKSSISRRRENKKADLEEEEALEAMGSRKPANPNCRHREPSSSSNSFGWV